MTQRHPGPRRFTAGAFVWLGTIALGALLSVIIVAFAIWSLATGPSKHDQLVERGILDPDEHVVAIVDLSPEDDLSEGCVITRGRAMSWRGSEIESSVALAGSSITVQRTEVTIHGNGKSVVCRFRSTDRAENFADDVARETLRTRPQT